MTRPITGSQPTRSMKAKESAFARITSAATKAMSPITIKDCTVSNGIAAVFIEHMKLPIAVGQLQYSQHPVGNLAPSSTDQKLKPSIVARSTVNNTLPVAKKGFEIRADIFPMNVAKPVSTSRIPWPKLGDNIHSTPQLALCATLLLKEEEVDAHGAKDDNIRREWVAALKEPIEQDRIHWAIREVIKKFSNETINDAEEIAEVVILAPVLDREYFRELLSCIIRKFKESNSILKEPLVYALIQLIQCSKPGYLEADDLINILSILRARLQTTHVHTTKYLSQLTLAVSSVLDVMAENKVNDLDRVQEHEPLSEVLSSLKGTVDPYLIYQAAYAFQALQYVPDNETAAQEFTRVATGVAQSMVKLSAVLKMDLGEFLDGLKDITKTVAAVIDVAVTGYEAASSMINSGQGILESLRSSVGKGYKLPWYSAVRRGEAFVREGQLADLCRLIREAPCRKDSFFQWGVSQLLGGIATDSNWEVDTRKQAVDFLFLLFNEKTEWGQDVNVRNWTLTLLVRVSTLPIEPFSVEISRQDQAVKEHACILLESVQSEDMESVFKIPYPVRPVLPLPKASRLLKVVKDVPNVEFDLSSLKRERLDNNIMNMKLYIPLRAKAHLKEPDSSAFPLMEYVQNFLAGSNHVLLILGDSGSGKSTFNLHLEHELWGKYQPGNESIPIPLLVNLAGLTQREQSEDMISYQLGIYGITEKNKIKQLKQNRNFILICDGYDELGTMQNLYALNKLNQGPGYWRAKMIITCRSTYVGENYLSLFKPLSAGSYSRNSKSLIQEAVIVPFMEDQIKDYVDLYIQDNTIEQLKWGVETYMNALENMPSLMDLAKNPFLLTLALDVLPVLVGDRDDLSRITVTRLILYDKVIEIWIEKAGERLLSGGLSGVEQIALELFFRLGFTPSVTDHLRSLAKAIYKEQNGNPYVIYSERKDKNTWKAEFFGLTPEATILRLLSPLIRNGEMNSFIHLSVLDYFFSRVIYNPEQSLVDCNTLSAHPLTRQTTVSYLSILQFLAERVLQDPKESFKNQLFDIIERSKSDPSESVAAANAITILVKAGVSFNGKDLSGIRIPGADLTGGQFDSTHFQGADLTGVTLTRTWIHQANFNKTQMDRVQFGELPYIKTDCLVYTCCYSPDGRSLCVGLSNNSLELYDTSTWTKTRVFRGHAAAVLSLSYSSDNQHIVSGSHDGAVRVWDVQLDEPILVLDEYPGPVVAVAFSPSGQQFASTSGASFWVRETKSGAILSVFNETNGLTIEKVIFSPCGSRLASAIVDGTIQLWDLQPAKPKLDASESQADESAPSLIIGGKSYSSTLCIAFSPSGQHIVSGHENNNSYIWDVTNGEHLRTLSGHTSSVRGIAYSSSNTNSRWIATGSIDGTVRLWNAETGNQIYVFAGHKWVVTHVAFSLDHPQIASSSYDGTIRLWDMNLTVLETTTTAIRQNGGAVSCLTYSPDGHEIFSGGRDMIVWQWDASTGNSRPLIPNYSTPIGCIAHSPKNNQIATAGYDTAVRLNKAQNGESNFELWGHYGIVSGLAFSPCGQWIASSSYDTTVKLWDTRSGEPGNILSGPVGNDSDPDTSVSGGLTCVAYSPSGHQVAAGSESGRIFIWDPRHSGQPNLVLSGHEDSIISVTFAPAGQETIASCSADKTVCIWNIQSGALLHTFHGHPEKSYCVSYSTCGNWLAAGALDGVVYLWRKDIVQSDIEQTTTATDSWSCVYTLRAFHGVVNGVTWSPTIDTSDQLEFATACDDFSVRVWKVGLKGDNGIYVSLKWGSCSGRHLIANNAVIENPENLSKANEALLLQRGAIKSSSAISVTTRTS